VLQAEANLHDASAKIGIAIANRLPNIMLTANAGSSAAAIDQLFTSGTGFWGIGRRNNGANFPGRYPDASGTRGEGGLYPGGRTISKHGAYRLSNVADTLTALEQDADALKAASAAADAAKIFARFGAAAATGRYAGYLALLSAEQAFQQSRINLLQRKPIVMPTPRRCFRHSAADGGIARI